MRLHLHLEHVVTLDLVGAQVRQTRRFDDEPGSHIAGDGVFLEQSCSVLLRQAAGRIVFEDLILLNCALRIDQDDAVEVVVDRVVLDQ